MKKHNFVSEKKRPLVLAVTGPMAAGKNAASSILEERGFACTDADILVHKAIENQKECILKTFSSLAGEKGIKLTDEKGNINRRALGSLIFTSPLLIKKQEDIVFPEVDHLIQEFLKENLSSGKNCAINATVLYKVPSVKDVDLIIYVDAPFVQRFFRAKKRDGLPKKQILERFKAQKNLFTKYKFLNADIERVWNTGSRKSLKKKIDRILRLAGRG